MIKTTTTAIIGFFMLVIGLALGAAAAETGSMPKITQVVLPAPSPAPQSATSNIKPGTLGDWNPFQEMRDLQAQIDQSFDKMVERFRTDPQFCGFKDYPGYSLSLDVRDLKDRYEVQADLPDAKASDVDVSLKNGRTLNVEVSRKTTGIADQKNTATSMTELGQYDQMVQLPTPVKTELMKIQHEGHKLIITIPKAA
jgi:HSP20 family molecular chaperone IbpA